MKTLCGRTFLNPGVFLAFFLTPLSDANPADRFLKDFLLPPGTNAVEWNIVYTGSLIVQGRLLESVREDTIIQFTSEAGERAEISYAEFDLEVHRIIFSDLSDAADTPALRGDIDGKRVRIRVAIDADHLQTFPLTHRHDDEANIFVLSYSPALFCHSLVPALQTNDIELIRKMLKVRRDKLQLLERFLAGNSGNQQR